MNERHSTKLPSGFRQESYLQRLEVKRVKGGFQYIDETGTPLCEDVFSRAEIFVDGLAAVSDFGTSYHINIFGKPAYTPRYDWVGSFSNGKAQVAKNGQTHWINVDGDVIE